MIFQDPYTSLNPRHTVGSIVGAPLRIHKIVPEKQVLSRVQELLEIVGLNPEHYNRYPQRVLRRPAAAHRHRPRPDPATRSCSWRTSRSPRSTCRSRRRWSTCCRSIQQEFGVAFLFIAHDLAIVRHFCPEVAVMYLGKIVEIGDRESIYLNAHHPYTQALLSAVPEVKQAAIGGRRERIRLDRRRTLSPINPPSGCRFRTRCPIAQEICAKVEPPLLQIGPEHKVACHFPDRSGHTPTEPVTSSLLGVDEPGQRRLCRERDRPRPSCRTPATPTPGTTWTRSRLPEGDDQLFETGPLQSRRTSEGAGGGALSSAAHAAAPLAVRMRPRTLEELVGQEQLRAPGSPLRQLVEGDQSMSLLLWGPPGTGKTTIAAILSQQTDRRFVEVSAVSAGVKEVRAAIDAARSELVATGNETVLFVDEVHRFSKAQQDALLPGVENRWVTLVAATTENPFFSVISPLLSRSLLLRLEPLTDDDIRAVLAHALADERGLGGAFTIEDDALDHVVRLAGGDARRALTYLEAAAGAASARDSDHHRPRDRRDRGRPGGGPLRPGG